MRPSHQHTDGGGPDTRWDDDAAPMTDGWTVMLVPAEVRIDI